MPNTKNRFPPLQDFNWRPATDSLPARYHLHNYENVLAYDLIDDGELQKIYAQKLQHDARARFYLDTTGVSVKVEWFNVAGVLQFAQTFSSPTAVYTDNVYNGMQLNTFYNNLSVPSVTGFHQLQMTVTYANATTDVFLSEVLDMKADHPDTILLEFTHNVNDFDIRFEQLFCKFQFRIEGRQPLMVLGSQQTISEGYNKQTTTLKSQSWRSWKWEIGGVHGVPPWMADKINRFKDCNTTLIEGVRYACEESTKVEIKDIDGYPLKGVSLQMRDYKHDTYMIERSEATLLTITSYPAALRVFGMVNSQLVLTADPTARVFYDQADLEAYKVWLDSTFTVQEGLLGAYQRTGDTISYINGPGETYIDTVNEIRTKYLTVNLHMASISSPWQYAYNTGTFGNAWTVVDWGDGNIQSFGNTNSAQAYATHAYGVTDFYTVNIFHNDNVRELKCNNQLYGGKVRGFDNEVPANLQTFDFRYGDLSANGVNFDPSFLFPARYTLKNITMPNNKIDGFNPGLFSSVGNGVWSQLIYCDLRGNSLSSAEVDEVFVNKLMNSQVVPGGSYLLKLQSPSAPPTSASYAARTILTVNLVCIINHD